MHYAAANVSPKLEVDLGRQGIFNWTQLLSSVSRMKWDHLGAYKSPPGEQVSITVEFQVRIVVQDACVHPS